MERHGIAKIGKTIPIAWAMLTMLILPGWADDLPLPDMPLNLVQDATPANLVPAPKALPQPATLSTNKAATPASSGDSAGFTLVSLPSLTAADPDLTTTMSIQSDETPTLLVSSSSPDTFKEEIHLQTVRFGDDSDDSASGMQFPIDMTSLVTKLVKRNLDYIMAGSDVEIAKGQFIQSLAPLFPSLNSQYSVERFIGGEVFFGPVPVNLNRVTYRPTISGNYFVQTGGQALFDIRAAKAHWNGAVDLKDQTFQNSMLSALTEYFNWLENIARENLAQRSLEEADAQVQYNLSRVRAGFGTELEVMQAKTFQAEQEGLLLRTRNDTNTSQYRIIGLLDLPISTELVARNPRLGPYHFVDDEISLEKWFTLAAANRSDIRVLDDRIKEARAQFVSDYVSIFPTLQLSGYTRAIGQDPSQLRNTKEGMFTATVDLLRNMGVDMVGRTKASRENWKKAILAKEKQLNNIKQTLSKAYYDWQYNRAQLAVVSYKIDSAREAYRIAQSRYHSQIGIQLEVIQARQKLLEAEYEYQQILKDFTLAQLQLLYESGQLTPAKVIQGAT